MMDPRPHLGSYLEDLREAGKETAYVYARGLRTHRMNYGQLAGMAWQTARWLREGRQGGLGLGERVILWGENSGEWAAAFWGCLAAGLVAVPVDGKASPAYVARIAEDTGARLVLYEDGQPVEETGHGRCVRLAALGETVEAFPAIAPETEGVCRSTLAQIIYTSGSTASPKGVCLTHGNTLASLEPLEREIARYRRWEKPFHPVRFLVQLPLSHVFGQMLGLFIPPLLRGEMHFLPELSPADVVETIRRRKISVMATVPRYLEVLGSELRRGSEKRWGEMGFASRLEAAQKGHFLWRWWRFRDIHARLGWKFWAFVCGGASLPEETETLWHRLGYAVIQGYGMTETASLVSVNHPFRMSRGSIGKSMPGREIRIGEGGQILVRGQNLSPGYWKREGGLQPLAETSDWFETGDLAEVDQEGNLFFRGRSKELIVAANGLNIVPEDLEAALRREPEIRDATVVGVEGPNGPEPFAVLLGAGADREGLKAAVARANGQLEVHQRFSRWELWPEPDFPRTATRKVRRGTVREWAQAVSSGRSVEAVRANGLEEVLLANGARWEGELEDAARLGIHLGLDSLGRVQLMAALEGRFQVRLEEGGFTEETTVGDVRTMLARELGAIAGVIPSRGDGQNAREAHTQAEATRRQPPYPFANWPSTRWASAFRQVFCLLAMRPLVRFFSARAGVVGVEHLDALTGPALFVSNHLSSIDGALIVGRLPWGVSRKVAIAMSGEMLRGYRYPAETERWYWKLWLPLQYLLVALVYHVFPLPRTSGFRQAFQHAGRLADKGYSILVFPEGTRSYRGEILPFQQGIGILARELGLPVVPLRLKGIHELREQGRSVARRGEVSIHVGVPLRFGAEDEPGVIARRLEEAVREL